MGRSLKEQSTTNAERGGIAPPLPRSLVLVAGSGRSGTSLFTGLLQRLGFRVPQPEVPADTTNPRGFAESQWVVDFHTRVLRRAGVQVSDARPGAWADVADATLDEDVLQELRTWLRRQFREADDVIIKDPRLSWFLSLWRRCAEDAGVSPRFASVLRHPVAVIDSKQRSYGAWQGDVTRTAGWVNQMLFTERATREAPRVFVRYTDLLEDWPRAVARVGEVLDLAIVRDASASSMREAHQFVDLALSRSRSSWDDLNIPAGLRELADEVWELMCRLADDGDEDQSVCDRLDAARAAYIDLYSESEAIAQSSILAAGRSGVHARRGPRALGVFRVAERAFPARYRSKVPLHWRKAIFRVLYGSKPLGDSRNQPRP